MRFPVAFGGLGGLAVIDSISELAGPARLGLFLVIALAWIYPTLLRLDGTTSDIKVTVNYRWKPTPEEIFLAEKEGFKLKLLPIRRSAEMSSFAQT